MAVRALVSSARDRLLSYRADAGPWYRAIRHVRSLFAVSGRRYICAHMSVAQEIPIVVTCPNQHELWVKVATSSPPQPQPVRCPLCDEAQDVLLPRITKVEVL